MLGKLTKQFVTDHAAGGKGGCKSPVSKQQVKKEIRRINTEKFAGGRGSSEGVLRTEKRGGRADQDQCA